MLKIDYQGRKPDLKFEEAESICQTFELYSQILIMIKTLTRKGRCYERKDG